MNTHEVVIFLARKLLENSMSFKWIVMIVSFSIFRMAWQTGKANMYRFDWCWLNWLCVCVWRFACSLACDAQLCRPHSIRPAYSKNKCESLLISWTFEKKCVYVRKKIYWCNKRKIDWRAEMEPSNPSAMEYWICEKLPLFLTNNA